MHSAQELLRRHGKSDEQIPNWTPQSEPAPAPPLALANWLTRDLPPSDLLLPWLSTTSRVLIAAFTGIGKTMFGIGLGMAAADGSGFLHWRGVRPARVLFIDGEMSRRLLQQRA
jgi:RecA-family ATPase